MNLRKQAVTTKCRGEFQCGAKNRDFEKAVDFRAKKRMKSVDKESDHRGGIDHRLTQICTD